MVLPTHPIDSSTLIYPKLNLPLQVHLRTHYHPNPVFPSSVTGTALVVMVVQLLSRV